MKFYMNTLAFRMACELLLSYDKDVNRETICLEILLQLAQKQ